MDDFRTAFFELISAVNSDRQEGKTLGARAQRGEAAMGVYDADPARFDSFKLQGKVAPPALQHQ